MFMCLNGLNSVYIARLRATLTLDFCYIFSDSHHDNSKLKFYHTQQGEE